MRQITVLHDGKFQTRWHFDSRADFLACAPLFPAHVVAEYAPLFPPPTRSPYPVILLRVRCCTGLLAGETRLHHMCPPKTGDGEGLEQHLNVKKWKLAKTKIFAAATGGGGGGGWKDRTTEELLAASKETLESVYDPAAIALGDWSGFLVNGEAVRATFPHSERTISRHRMLTWGRHLHRSHRNPPSSL